MQLEGKNMKRLLAIPACAAVALLPLEADATTTRWTGCGVGVQAGYSATIVDVGFNVFKTAGAFEGLGADGATYGLKAGCDMQMDRIVIGAWGDYSWFSSQDLSLTVSGLGSISAGFDQQWAAGARAGLLVTDRTLVYALVGYTDVRGASFVPDFSGMVYGGGIEIGLGNDLFGSLEYRYADLDKLTLTSGPNSISFDPNMHQIRAGLTYRFSLPDPVPVK